MSLNVRRPALILALGWLAAAPATAQDGGIPAWVEADPFARGEDDPLGVDRADRLDSVAPTRADEEVHAPVPVRRGEALVAIAGVREDEHAVEVRLASGLAIVDVSMRFVSSARHAAEVGYRLAVPEGASIAALEVCNVHGCRSGAIDETTALGPYDDAVRSHASGASPLPVAHAAPIEDARGHAVWLRAAPVLREGRPIRAGEAGLARTPPGDGPLSVRLRYVVPAPVRGGRVRLSIPARGHDERAAPARIRVRSEELSGARVAGADAVERSVERRAGEGAEITARLAAAPPVALQAWRVRCGRAWCTRLRAVAAPRPIAARDVILLIDASPSTRGPARGRIGPAVGTLLASLPSRSRVRIAVFAARAEAVTDGPVAPTEVALVDVSRALERELGSATRFEAAWARIEPWVDRARDPLVVLVGDGGLTTGLDARRAFARARSRGVTLASLNVADRPTTPGLRAAIERAGGLVMEAGPQADRAARGHGTEALEERIAQALSPVVAPRVIARAGGRAIDLGPLRAGEELVWEGAGGRALGAAGRSVRVRQAPSELAIELALRDRIERAAGRRDRPLRLAAVAPESIGTPGSCGAATLRSASAPVTRDVHLVLVEPRRCEAPPEAPPARTDAPEGGRIARLARRGDQRGLPARTLLEMLRQRIVPVARGCFRSDRAGRPNYQTRAVFELRLADREVASAEVSGRITPELRACLLRSVDDLDIPAFDGTVRVRYPIYTAPELPPPTLALDPDVADMVDAITREDP